MKTVHLKNEEYEWLRGKVATEASRMETLLTEISITGVTAIGLVEWAAFIGKMLIALDQAAPTVTSVTPEEEKTLAS